MSFNIVFGANSGPLDPDDREYTTFPSQTPFVKTTDVSCFTDFEETDDDTEYTPQEIEDSDPYEYDSDISTDVSSNEDTPEDEESIDTTDTESQQYTEWVKKTFNPNCRDPEEHVGYYDASDSTYSINIIFPEEARGCRTAQFLHHKNSVWQPDELHEPWEVNGDWALSGICDGMPSRDCDIPTVWPARGGVEQLEADNSSYHVRYLP